jgi:hypothetical protein
MIGRIKRRLATPDHQLRERLTRIYEKHKSGQFLTSRE